MFDETKDVRIKIYKVVIIIMFFTIIIGGFIGFIILGRERLAAVLSTAALSAQAAAE